MHNAIVVKGRLVGPKSVELDEAISSDNAEVEVIVRTGNGVAAGQRETLSEFLRRLPPGNRSKADIDSQIREEREAWGDAE